MAIRWRGERIGYVPRRINADIARRLDAGDRLACRLTQLDERADPWERVEFAIRQAPRGLTAAGGHPEPAQHG